MTENTFALWKQRFPVLKNMRTNHRNSQKNISASAVLHNWALDLGDEPVDDGCEGPEEPPNNNYVIIEDNADRNVILRRGQERRDQLLAAMPRPTPRERRRGFV